MTLTVPRN